MLKCVHNELLRCWKVYCLKLLAKLAVSASDGPFNDGMVPLPELKKPHSLSVRVIKHHRLA